MTDIRTGRLVVEDDVEAIRRQIRESGKQLVFTNGCFDLLHPGHLHFLEECRTLGDCLWVGLNGDDSVRALKGPGRPILGESERAYQLASIRSVDFITIFHSTRATNLMRAVRPDVYAKASDYTYETLDAEEKAALQACQCRIQFLSYKPGFSTSGLLEDPLKK